jgi:hypothetical protein
MKRKVASTGRLPTDADRRARQYAPGPTAQPRPSARREREPRHALTAPQTLAPAQSALPQGLHVIDDLPEAVPVCAPELEVIETYLGTVLNELIGPQE